MQQLRARRAFSPPRSTTIVAASSASTSTSTSSSPSSPSSARLRTLDGCGLRISVYPPFSYNASGGGALVGTLSSSSSSSSEGGGGGGAGTKKRSELSFAPSSVSIPDLDFRTTRFLGLPLPPGLRIQIEPLKLEGWVEEGTGEVSLDFEARFRFTAFGLYRPPPLFVSTTLTTGEARSSSSSSREEREGKQESSSSRVKLIGRGEPLRPRKARGEEANGGGGGAGGPVALAGVAVVAPVGDVVLDSFLMLPTECLAELKAELEFF